MFVENVLSEVRGKAALVAMDQTGSLTLQRLLPLGSPEQAGEVLSELGGEAGGHFQMVCCDRCGGHVVESAVRQMSRSTGTIPTPRRMKRPVERDPAVTAQFVSFQSLGALRKRRRRRAAVCWRLRCWL